MRGLTGQIDLIDRASRMAQWEANIQMSSGAVQGGKVTTPDKQSPATFNTGMVLDGFVFGTSGNITIVISYVLQKKQEIS